MLVYFDPVEENERRLGKRIHGFPGGIGDEMEMKRTHHITTATPKRWTVRELRGQSDRAARQRSFIQAMTLSVPRTIITRRTSSHAPNDGNNRV